MKYLKVFILFPFIASIVSLYGQENLNNNKFKQLKEELATPNVYRTASGAPGHKYWQQRADYSKYTFDYPYPVAQSIHAASIGMEYPMICFNGGPPEPDGSYSERTKWSMIGVIIHEVGHNFSPMIVNSDERQWTWMDEGLNTFLQGISEREWDHNHPNWSGNPTEIGDYMSGDKKIISPIMVNSESILQFMNNAYNKPATALNILRETIMGRELFDFAFKQLLAIKN